VLYAFAMMSTLKKSLLSTSVILGIAAGGCVQQEEAPDGIARTIPTADRVSIKLPQNANRELGALADYYVVTRNVTRTLNGGTAWVLVLVHTIVQYPVTSTNGNVYTWGPWSDALDPAEYKLDVTDNGDGTYDYVLSGRSKTVAGAEFEQIIDGHAEPGATPVTGHGDFSIDFDAGKRVNPIDSGDAKGTVAITYDLDARHLDLVANGPDANGNPAQFTYAYNEAADGGGDMVFNANADAGGTSLAENIVIRSRWLVDGEGRGDARLAGGDLGSTEAIASECWGSLFQRVFYTDNVNFQATEGDIADCAFATPDLPPL
jgi:hypothetical protein